MYNLGFEGNERDITDFKMNTNANGTSGNPQAPPKGLKQVGVTAVYSQTIVPETEGAELSAREAKERTIAQIKKDGSVQNKQEQTQREEGGRAG